MLITTTQRVGDVATAAQLLYGDVRLGRPVFTALTNVATTPIAQRHQPIVELSAAIKRYLEQNPAMTGGRGRFACPGHPPVEWPLVTPVPHPYQRDLGVTPAQGRR